MKKGFTLIELVVVVTIILFLTVGAVVSFRSANTRARDSRRLADLQTIRSALEFYRQENPTLGYPAADGSNQAPALISGGYLPSWPTDPVSTQAYVYERPTQYTYNIYALVETMAMGGVSRSGCGGTCNYVLTNP